MIYAHKTLLKLSICIALVLPGLKLNAQVSLIQNVIDKLETYKNFGYQSIHKETGFGTDTTIIPHKDIFFRAPEDKNFGYLYSMEMLAENNKSNYTDLYNGQNAVAIIPHDSAYIPKQIQIPLTGLSLLGQLNWIKGILEKRPSKILKGGDTTIRGIISSRLIINTHDTVINKEHYHTSISLLIDKLSGLPTAIISESRTNYLNGIVNFYTEDSYFNYTFNRDDINVASFTIPNGFHEQKTEHPAPLLATGIVAPDWTLYTADGKKMFLSQMKGKVVLLDFYFIGCEGCMLALKPLNNLCEKYKNQNVIIASITERNSVQSVLAFEQQYNIKYTGFVNAADVVKSYHVQSFPTFYFIDKQGKIANVKVGYNDNFEATATSTINNLLNK